MKNTKYVILHILMLLSILITVVFLVFMSDEVPTHWNISGQIDGYGTKYTFLLFPLATVLMGLFFLFIASCNRKKEDHTGEKVVVFAAIPTLILFNAMLIYFGILSIAG